MEVLRQDGVAAVEHFRALAGSTWSPDRLSVWLFTGKVTQERGKRSAYWNAKVSALMAWGSLLAGIAIRADVWNGQRRPPSWSRIIQNVEQADQAPLRAWITAFRPLVEGWCFSTPEPQTKEEVLKRLFAPPPPSEDIRRDNIATRVFRLLNRRLEDAYLTRPGDVDRWEKIRKNRGHRLPEPPAYGQYTWYDGRLYEVATGKVVFEVPKDRSLFYPQTLREVVTRLFKYAGAFVAFGIATSDPARIDPVAPLPPGDALQWTCRFCNVSLRAAIIGNEPEVWCPRCFTEVHELAGVLSRWDDAAKTWKMVIPSS